MPNASGHPKVSTNRCASLCENHATELYAKMILKHHCMQGFLEVLIEGKNRIQDHKNRNPKHCGTYSFLEQAKVELVTSCIQMRTICQPLSENDGIELMNSLISGTNI